MLSLFYFLYFICSFFFSLPSSSCSGLIFSGPNGLKIVGQFSSDSLDFQLNLLTDELSDLSSSINSAKLKIIEIENFANLLNEKINFTREKIDNLRVNESTINLQDNEIGNSNNQRHGFLTKLTGNSSEFLSGMGNFTGIPLSALPSIPESKFSLTDVTSGNADSTRHGFEPKLNGNSDQYLNGNGIYSSIQLTAIPQISESKINLTDVITGNADSTRHGFLPKLSGDSSQFLSGSGIFTGIPLSALPSVPESKLSLSTSSTTGDVSTNSHGFAPKSNGNADQFLNGNGAYSSILLTAIPSIPESKINLTDITTGNADSTRHGFLPKLSGDSSQFLSGSGIFTGISLSSIPSITESKISLSDVTSGNVNTANHGFAPKSNGNADQFLNGNGSYSSIQLSAIPSITESKLSLSDLTVGNADSTRHGFLPKLPSVSPGISFLSGSGSWISPFPSGTVLHFAMLSSPSGWLICDGSAVSRSIYSNLFTAIGSLYGNGDGSTTFNLPDLRGEFIRGFDQGRGADAGRNFGSWQDSATAAPKTTNPLRRNADGSTTTVYTSASNPSHTAFVRIAKSGEPVTTSGLNVSPGETDNVNPVIGDPETRVRNVALLPCIKT